MPDSKTSNCNYVFVDVVGFTANRSVEAQTDVIQEMNAVVRRGLEKLNVPLGQTILIPTGDGVCVALLDVNDPYDIHLQLALTILRLVSEHNDRTEDRMREFSLRVGISSNTDNVVTDINGNRNVAGAGVSLAQRVMSLADGGQVLISSSVYEVVSQREAYMGLFAGRNVQDKHGRQMTAYQYTGKDEPGLDANLPAVFRTQSERQSKLSLLAAHYLAELIEHEELILELRAASSTALYSLIVTVYYRALDRTEAALAKKFDNPTAKARPAAGSFEEQFRYYDEQEFWLFADLGDFVIDKYLSTYWKCFDGPAESQYLFASDHGRERLKNEWPDLAKSIGL